MIESLAKLYVNLLEPAMMILVIVLVVVIVLYLFNILRGGAAKGDFLSTLVNGFMKMLVKTAEFTVKAVWGFFKAVIRTLGLVFATTRDFLFSKDL